MRPPFNPQIARPKAADKRGPLALPLWAVLVSLFGLILPATAQDDPAAPALALDPVLVATIDRLYTEGQNPSADWEDQLAAATISITRDGIPLDRVPAPCTAQHIAFSGRHYDVTCQGEPPFTITLPARADVLLGVDKPTLVEQLVGQLTATAEGTYLPLDTAAVIPGHGQIPSDEMLGSLVPIALFTDVDSLDNPAEAMLKALLQDTMQVRVGVMGYRSRDQHITTPARMLRVLGAQSKTYYGIESITETRTDLSLFFFHDRYLSLHILFVSTDSTGTSEYALSAFIRQDNLRTLFDQENDRPSYQIEVPMQP